MENVQNFTFIELRITQAALTIIIFFFRCELACLLEELAQSQTVILDDLARVKAVLLLIRTFLSEDDAAQLFRPQIFDERTDFYNIILQQSWILICF